MKRAASEWLAFDRKDKALTVALVQAAAASAAPCPAGLRLRGPRVRASPLDCGVHASYPLKAKPYPGHTSARVRSISMGSEVDFCARVKNAKKFGVWSHLISEP